MATEQGLVTKIGFDTAWVKTTKTESCKACAARESCHTLGGGKETEVEVINTVGAKAGDTVVLGFEDASLLKASFLIYIVPILAMMMGAAIGEKMAVIYHLDFTATSAILGFLFLFLSFLPLRWLGARLAKKEQYRPKIIRIKKVRRALSADASSS